MVNLTFPALFRTVRFCLDREEKSGAEAIRRLDKRGTVLNGLGTDYTAPEVRSVGACARYTLGGRAARVALCTRSTFF